MAKIKEKLGATGKAMETDAIKEGLGLELKQVAIDAMMEGIKPGGAWERYMSLFADNTAQLERLTVESDADPAYLRESRAYIVANAICGADSTTQTNLKVDDRVDLQLVNEPDGQIVNPGEPVPPGGKVRPFPIPKV